MKFEEYDYRIGSHFLPAIFNGDTSGLNEEEIKWLNHFEKNYCPGEGHWAGGDEEDHEEFARCEITGMMGDCHNVVWMQRV